MFQILSKGVCSEALIRVSKFNWKISSRSEDTNNTSQKMKFSKDFFSKCDEILRIWSHLLKKSLMENFIFCALVILSFLSLIFFISPLFSLHSLRGQKVKKMLKIRFKWCLHVLWKLVNVNQIDWWIWEIWISKLCVFV